MRLLELHLAGFGRLVDRKFTFAPGLNLIYGPNEAGKSTLQRAIMSMLFGYFDEGRISQEQRAVMAADKPWDTKAPFSGRLVYALDNGQRFLIKRTFSPRSQTSVTSSPDNADVSHQFRSASDGRLFFAESHLGMSRAVFGNVCSVRQAELTALESSAVDTITSTIMRLSAAGSSDTTTNDALATLERTMRDDVGSPRAWTKPLAQAGKRLVGLETLRSRSVLERSDLLTQIGALRQAEDELKQLNVDSQKLSYLHALAERNTLHQQKATVNEAAQVITLRAAEVTRWEQWAKFPVFLRDQVFSLEAQRRRQQEEYSRSEPRAVELAAALRPLRVGIAAAEAQIAELADARQISDEQLPAVSLLATQWRRAAEAQTGATEHLQKAQAVLAEASDNLAQLQAEIQPVITLGRSGLAKLQQQLANSRQRVAQVETNLRQAENQWYAVGMSTAQFSELERTVQAIQSGVRPSPPLRRGCNLFSFGKEMPAQTPTELVLYAQIKPIVDEGFRLQQELAEAKQQLKRQETEVIALLGSTVTASLDETAFEHLGARLDNQLQAQAVVNQCQSSVDDTFAQVKAAEEACSLAADALRIRLEGLGFADLDLERSLAAFANQRERKQRLVQEEANLERLQLQAQNLEREEEEHRRREKSLKDTLAQLLGLLRRAGIECSQSSLANALFAFREGVENQGHWEKATAAHDEAKRHHRELVEAQVREGVDSRMSEIDAAITELRSKYPEWAGLEPVRSAHDYAGLQEKTKQAHADAQDRYRRLKDAVERTSTSLRHPAEIDEEIASQRAVLSQLEWYRDALKMASEELAAATQEYQRQFAPKLERLMGGGLSRVSNSRYTAATVNPSTLDVSLRSPERHESVSVANLSTGTRDLIYLMLRIAIARLLSSGTESLPLMMDDPLVQFDRGRQERALEFISQLAGDTQVFLFSKDEWTSEWFKTNLDACAIHALHLLG